MAHLRAIFVAWTQLKSRCTSHAIASESHCALHHLVPPCSDHEHKGQHSAGKTARSEADVDAELAGLRSDFAHHKQEHLFAFADQKLLSAAQKAELLADLKVVFPFPRVFAHPNCLVQNIDLPGIAHIFKVVTAATQDKQAEFAPFEATTVKSAASDSAKQKWSVRCD
jgi:hypothetical protein